MNHLQFPLGHVVFTEYTEEIEAAYIKTIGDFHDNINLATTELSEEELSKQYRPEGWNIRQLVHHCADSHMNAYIRFKLALTEDNPTIKPYDEAAWAELPDSLVTIQNSLRILEGVHDRWSTLLQHLTKSDYQRTFYHPASQKITSLWDALAIYDWHCRHHLAHIELAKNT